MARDLHRFRDAREVAQRLKPSYPVFCVRPQVLRAAATRFLTLFPGKTLYAVKCNPHPLVMQALYDAGVRSFDAASLPEIAQVCGAWEDAEAYFMHPVKARAVIRTAHEVYGVKTFALDHPNELDKIVAETRGGEEIVGVVRMRTEDRGDTLYHLSAKFGAPPDEAAALLRRVAEAGLRPGLCFHVGSQCMHPETYGETLALAGQVIAAAGVEIACLDLGGGFPAAYVGMNAPPLETYMEVIAQGLTALDLPPGCEVLSEPGRALVADGCSLLVQVQLRKGRALYINDGIYGSLSEIDDAGIRFPARLIRLSGAPAEEMQTFTLNGPTCDSLDTMPDAVTLPADVREGDWIEIDRVGAYSFALATYFNGFHPDTFVEVEDDPPSVMPSRLAGNIER